MRTVSTVRVVIIEVVLAPRHVAQVTMAVGSVYDVDVVFGQRHVTQATLACPCQVAHVTTPHSAHRQF